MIIYIKTDTMFIKQVLKSWYIEVVTVNLIIFGVIFSGHPLLPDFFLDEFPDTIAQKMESRGKI